MKKRFGAKQPTGTPSLALSSVVMIVSLLAGASVVHNFFKPDLTLPPVESISTGSGTNGEKPPPEKENDQSHHSS